MPDPILHDHLTDPSTVRRAFQLSQGLGEIVWPVDRDATVVLISLTAMILAVCQSVGFDPSAAFEQVADGILSGEVDIKHDPAGGRFVHQSAHA